MFFENLEKSKEQEVIVRKFLEPHFDAITMQRSKFLLPSPEDIVEAMAKMVEQSNGYFEVTTNAR